jgi:alpha-galactosidase/6-phospho-beta-glucosidase family protein
MEAAGRLSEGGLERPKVPDYPGAYVPLLRRLEDYQRQTAKVAAGGASRSEAVEALAANPLVPDRAVAEAMLERAQTLYGDKVPLFR